MDSNNTEWTKRAKNLEEAIGAAILATHATLLETRTPSASITVKDESGREIQVLIKAKAK